MNWDGSLAWSIDMIYHRLLSEAEKEREKTKTEEDKRKGMAPDSEPPRKQSTN